MNCLHQWAGYHGGYQICGPCRHRRALGGTRWLPDWEPNPVEPVGVEVGRTVHGPMSFEVYPPPPADFRAARDVGGRVLREAATHVGMRPSELSALEMGRAVLDDEQAALLVALLREVPSVE